MSVKDILAPNGKILAAYLGNGAVSTFGEVLQAGNSAAVPGTNIPQDMTDCGLIACTVLETGKVVQQQNQLSLEIGETGDDLQILGATAKGSILVGSGALTKELVVGANGLVLKANSNAANGLGVEWGTDASGGTVTSVSGGVNIDVTGAIATPTVNLQNPLTAQLNLGSQQLAGSSTGGTETTTLNINSGSVAPATGVVEMDFVDINANKTISAFNNIRIDSTEAGAVMSWDTNDTVAGLVRTALKIETIKENEHNIDLTITDTGGTENGSITRTVITRGDNVGCEDTITSTDTTNNRSALRKEETDWAFGIVDTSTYSNSAPLANVSRISTTNSTTIQDAYNFNDGINTSSYSTSVGASGSTTNNSITSAGTTFSSQIATSTSLVQHQLRRTAGTQNAYVQNNAQLNLSRLQGQLIDTGVGNYSTIDTTNSQCEIRQQVLVSGITKNTSLLTTNALTTLSTDAPLTISTSGNNLNLTSAGQVVVQATSGAMFLNANSGSGRIAMSVGGNTRLDLDTINTTLTNPTSSGGGTTTILGSGVVGKPALILSNAPSNLANNPTTLEMFYNKSIAGATNDIPCAINFFGEDATSAKVQFGGIESVITSAGGGGGVDGAMDFYTCVNGTKSLVMRLNGADNENNSFRPLDMNGNTIRSTSGDMIISTLPSSGTGSLSVQAKDYAQLGGETQYTNIYNTNGNINLTAGGAASDLVLTCPNWQSATSGGNSGQHLRIKLNGVYYKIALQDD